MIKNPSPVSSRRASRFNLVVNTHLVSWSLTGSSSVPWRVIVVAAVLLGGSVSDSEPGRPDQDRRLLQENCSESERDWP